MLMEPQHNQDDDYEWEELDYNDLIRRYLPTFEIRFEILVTEEVIEPATEELFKYDFERIRTYLDHQRRVIERKERRIAALEQEVYDLQYEVERWKARPDEALKPEEIESVISRHTGEDTESTSTDCCE